jgi:hypothetical protein
LNLISGKIAGSSIGKNRDETKNSRLLQVELTDPADVQTVELISRSGEENNPPLGGRVIVAQVGSAWKIALADDDAVEPSAAAGEKYLYSTNETGTQVKAEIKLLNTGGVLIDNGETQVELDASGNVNLTNSGDLTLTSNNTVINNNVTIIGNLIVTGTISGASISTPNGGIDAGGTLTAVDAQLGESEIAVLGHVHEVTTAPGTTGPME